MVDKSTLKNILKELGYSDFETLVFEFQHNVYSTVYTYTQNKADAEDISQEVFLLIYKNLSTFKLGSKLSTWIYKITINRCKMFYRTQARRKSIAKFVPISNEMNQSMPSKTDVDSDVIKNEDKQILYEAMKAINQKYVSVITLRYMQDLSIKEIGQILELPPRTVETQLYRARGKLKQELKSLGYGLEEKYNGIRKAII